MDNARLINADRILASGQQPAAAGRRGVAEDGASSARALPRDLAKQPGRAGPPEPPPPPPATTRTSTSPSDRTVNMPLPVNVCMRWPSRSLVALPPVALTAEAPCARASSASPAAARGIMIFFAEPIPGFPSRGKYLMPPGGSPPGHAAQIRIPPKPGGTDPGCGKKRPFRSF